MSCEELESLLPEYWSGTLPPARIAQLEEHLRGCDTCRDEASALGALWRRLGALPDEQPSPMLQARFDRMLAAWREGAGTGRVLAFDPPASRDTWRLHRWIPTFQVAAAVLLVTVGFAAGRLAPARESAEQMAELRGELRTMRELVTVSLLQQQSAADRLRGVTWSQQIDQPGKEVLDALLDTLRRDANVNVRLAAIDALKQFGRTEQVRDGLLQAVGSQSSPLVQIELIDTLVELREARSREVLHRLANDDKADKAVQQRARWGLAKIG